MKNWVVLLQQRHFAVHMTMSNVVMNGNLNFKPDHDVMYLGKIFCECILLPSVILIQACTYLQIMLLSCMSLCITWLIECVLTDIICSCLYFD